MNIFFILFVCSRKINHDVCLSVTLEEELRMRDVKSWKPHDKEEVRSSGDKSVDGVPSVQNPLGSSIIIPHDS